MSGKNNDAKNIADKIILYLQSKNKLDLVTDISKQLLEYVELNTKVVFIYSAEELTVEQKKKVKSKFQKITGVDNFIFALDKKLIAGILVKYGDKIWDLSLENNLGKIKTH